MPVIINWKICDSVKECGGIEVCPTGAIYWDEEKKAVKIDNSKCTSCGQCEPACPASAITVVGTEEELRRIIPIIGKIKELLEIPVSVDTYKAQIAQEAIEAGADMINDIGGLRFDSELKQVVAKYKVPLVLMHIKGSPKDMQNNPYYDSLLGEIISYLRESIVIAKEAGIDEESIVIDPGIGFGKSARHNLEIINKLSELKSLGRPILIGVSRKSFIGNVLNLPLQERLEGSLAATCLAVTQGARMVRTHDVKETRRAIDLTQAIINS